MAAPPSVRYDAGYRPGPATPAPGSVDRTPVASATTTKGGAMTTTTRFVRRDPADVKPWAETCGQIRCLIEEKDGAAGEVHHVQIQDAKLHYHERTDEFYYVIAGRGTMLLDGEEVGLHPGGVVYVPRGVKHKARGDLTVLVVCVLAGV